MLSAHRISSQARIARVFNNGRSRAVRIPKEFEFDADTVEIRRDENGDLILHPVKTGALLALLATLEPLTEEDRMPEIEDFASEPFDLDDPA